MTKDCFHGVGHSPVCQILLQIVVRAVITSSPPARTSFAGMLSTPVDFPFFSDCTAESTSPLKGGRECVISLPCLESQGCHLIPLYYFLSFSSPYSYYSFCHTFFSARWSILLNSFQKILQYFFIKRKAFFCMAPV